MLRLRKIAVTGNLAAGKSTVCHLLKKLGAYVLDSDKIVHSLLLNNSSIKKAIIKLLGEEGLTKGRIDRSKIAKIVFNSKKNKKLLQLEKIIHPEVLKKIKQKYQEIKKKNQYQLFVVEMPLLFETKSEKLFNFVIAVIANQKICSERFGKDYQKRKQRQMNSFQKIKKADVVIYNNQDLKSLKKQITNLYSHLTHKENK